VLRKVGINTFSNPEKGNPEIQLKLIGYQEPSRVGVVSLVFDSVYFTWAATALNASGWFMAKSAKTFRLRVMFLRASAWINFE